MKDKRTIRKGGFTLVELLLTTVIGALVIVTALGTLRQISSSRAEAQYYSDVSAHGRYALNQIRDDLANFYRSLNPEKMRLVGIEGGTEEEATDRLQVQIVQEGGLHGKRIEGQSDIYEVEYGLCEDMEQGTTFLGRRCGAIEEATLGNEGGTLTRVAEYIQAVRFEYYDGSAWLRNWELNQGVPKLVRVSLVLADAGRPAYRPVRISQVVSLEPIPTRTIEIENGHRTADIQKTNSTE
jgi:general secretion pathway protein J